MTQQIVRGAMQSRIKGSCKNSYYHFLFLHWYLFLIGCHNNWSSENDKILVVSAFSQKHHHHHHYHCKYQFNLKPYKFPSSLSSSSSSSTSSSSSLKNKKKDGNNKQERERQKSELKQESKQEVVVVVKEEEEVGKKGGQSEMEKNDNNHSPFSIPESFKAQTKDKLKEMYQRNERGEILSQEYCDRVLGLCVACNEWENVLKVLEIMNDYNIVQERSTYQSCLQLCFEVGNGSSALDILATMNHALVIPKSTDLALIVATLCKNDKFDPNHAYYNTNTATSANDSSWCKKALDLLMNENNCRNTTPLATSSTEEEEKTNNNDINTDPGAAAAIVPVEAYDAILNRLIECKAYKEAIQLLKDMENCNDEPVSTSNNKKAILPIHPKPALSTYRNVVECCIVSSQTDEAIKLVNHMVNEKKLAPTLYTFELIISAMCKKLQWRKSIQLLDLMDQCKVSKSTITYNTIISACCRSKEITMAEKLLTRMKKIDNIKPNTRTFNALISACANTSRWKDALRFLAECAREPGVTPDIYSYTNAMRACAKGGKTERALTLLQVAGDLQLPVDTYCYSAVIEACAKQKMWKKALELLDEMESKGIVPSEVTYSVTISACGNGGQWKKALDLLQIMRKKKMKINLITYNAAITALSKAAKQNSRWSSSSKQQTPKNKQNLSKKKDTAITALNKKKKKKQQLSTIAMNLLLEMKKNGLLPDRYSFSAAISCCGCEGKWKEALDLIELMKKGGPRTKPNIIVYTAAISACGRAGEYEHAIQLFFRDMKDQGVVPDQVAYNALFSALRVSGKASLAYDLWCEMCGNGSAEEIKNITIANKNGQKKQKKERSTSAESINKRNKRNINKPSATREGRKVDVMRPDIITVTDVIAVLSRSKSKKDYIDRVDNVFNDAVELDLVLRGDSLDLTHEFDLSGMSLTVARAAVRYIIKRLLLSSSSSSLSSTPPENLSFITGVGKMGKSGSSFGKQVGITNAGSSRSTQTASLRDYVKEILLKDFDPPIKSSNPRFAQGIVEVDRDSLESWIKEQNTSKNKEHHQQKKNMKT